MHQLRHVAAGWSTRPFPGVDVVSSHSVAGSILDWSWPHFMVLEILSVVFQFKSVVFQFKSVVNFHMPLILQTSFCAFVCICFM